MSNHTQGADSKQYACRQHQPEQGVGIPTLYNHNRCDPIIMFHPRVFDWEGFKRYLTMLESPEERMDKYDQYEHYNDHA